jgi:hypothetical protein
MSLWVGGLIQAAVGLRGGSGGVLTNDQPIAFAGHTVQGDAKIKLSASTESPNVDVCDSSSYGLPTKRGQDSRWQHLFDSVDDRQLPSLL